MSATPPYGSPYDQPSGNDPRPRSNQWGPEAGRPRQQYGAVPPGGPSPPNGPSTGPTPRAGGPGPSAGGQQRPQAGRAVPRAGGPGGHPSPPQRPYPPQRPQQQPPASQTPRQVPPQEPPQQSPARPTQQEPLSREPFEEAAFADESTGSDWSGEGTQMIGKIGYAPRGRSVDTRVRKRAKKTNPLPGILVGVLVLALLAAGGWWLLNREDDGEDTVAESGLAYPQVDEPCALADVSPLDGIVDTASPTMDSSARDRTRGWEQRCVLSFGSVETSVATLEFDATVFDSDAKARVNYDLGVRGLADLEAWSDTDAPELPGETTAVVRAAEGDGTSNYQIHLQDGNVYLVVRLALSGSGLDEQGLGDLAGDLTGRYLDAWGQA